VPGRKTRPPGRCSGGSPRSPFLRLRQPHPTPLSCGHRLRLLDYALAVVGPPFWSKTNGCRRPPHSLLGRAVLLRRHRRCFPPVAISVGGRQLPHFGGRFSAPSFLGGGCGELAPLCAAAGGRHGHPWAVLRGCGPLTVSGYCPDTGWRPIPLRRLLYTFTLSCCRATPCGWLAGQSGAHPSPPPSPGGISTPPPLSAAAPSPHTATGGWLAGLQRQFPKVFFQDAAASSLVPAHCVQHIIQTVG
jgi:hypothetical protein